MKVQSPNHWKNLLKGTFPDTKRPGHGTSHYTGTCAKLFCTRYIKMVQRASFLNSTGWRWGHQKSQKPPTAQKHTWIHSLNTFFSFSEEPLEGHLHLKSLAQKLLVALWAKSIKILRVSDDENSSQLFFSSSWGWGEENQHMSLFEIISWILIIANVFKQ